MHLKIAYISSLLAAAPLASCHFLLRTPTSIGYTDSTESTAPCGGYTSTDRSKGVTNWTVAGQPVGLTTTHSSASWEFRAALLSAPSTWVNLMPIVYQTGYPYFCERQVPGIAAWVGQDAILQVIQHTSHGDLYQCSAIKFVSGGPTAPSSTTCTNSTGVTAHY